MMKTVKVVGKRTPETVRIDYNAMPAYQSDAMCRTLIKCVERFFENPEVRADFERWKQEQQDKH